MYKRTQQLQPTKFSTSNYPTTEAGTSSNGTLKRKKRGFSLCKDLSNRFDEIYGQRDLVVEEKKPQRPQQMVKAFGESTRVSSKKFLSSLHSVKSQKLLTLQQGRSQDKNSISRIALGKRRKQSKYKIDNLSEYQSVYDEENPRMQEDKSKIPINQVLSKYNYISKQKKYASDNEYGIIKKR